MTTSKGIVYAFANQKGGVGKTTTVIHTGLGLALKGQKLLIVDMDPQMSSSEFFLKNSEEFYNEKDSETRTLYSTLIHKQPLNIYNSRYENIDIAPSHLNMASTDLDLASAKGVRETRLQRELDLVKHNYDYVLIDCPPSLSMLALNSFAAANRLVIIVEPDQYSLNGITQLDLTIQLIEDELGYRPELRGFLINSGLKRSLATREVQKQLTETFGEKLVYKTYLPMRADIKNVQFNNISMFEVKAPAGYDENDYVKAINNFISQEFNI